MIVLLAIFILILFYAYKCIGTLHYQKNDVNLFILERCSYVRQKLFIFTPYLFNGFIQAYFASKVQDKDPQLYFKREFVEFGLDFGYFALDWAYYNGVLNKNQADKPDGRPILLLLSGLTASKAEPYIINFCSKAAKDKSWRVVLYNDRLYNNRIYLDPKRSALPIEGYMNYVEDFRRVLTYLKEKYPDSDFYAIGHSFGSNTLVRYLGMCGSSSIDTMIKAAVSICNPFDFQLGIKYLEDGLADNYIRKHRQRILGLKIDQFNPPPKHIQIDFEKAFTAKKAYNFDYEFTRNIFGAPTVDYHFLSVPWQSNILAAFLIIIINSVNMLDYVKVPILYMGCYDDPVINKASFPLDELQRNPNAMVFMTKVGGHISWFSGWFHPRRWYHKPVLQYIRAIIEYNNLKK